MRAKLERVQNDASETGESTKRCERNWGENKMPVGLGSAGGENRETITASHRLAFTGLVATATATADWSKRQ